MQIAVPSQNRKATTEHASHQLGEPLAGINILITGGMGRGLHDRLMQGGILPVVTMEDDPDAAVAALLTNSLERLPAQCDHRGHGHDHPSQSVRQRL